VSDLNSDVADQIPEALARQADFAALWRKVVSVYLELRREMTLARAWPLEEWQTATKIKIFNEKALWRIVGGGDSPWTEQFVMKAWFLAEELIEGQTK
jgi:hypothetical protein